MNVRKSVGSAFYRSSLGVAVNPDPEAFDDERELDDPALEAVADAILEGAPIDWTAAENPAAPPTRSLERQLRVLSDMAAVHRTLLAGEPAIVGRRRQPRRIATIDVGPSATLGEGRPRRVRRSVSRVGSASQSRGCAQATRSVRAVAAGRQSLLGPRGSSLPRSDPSSQRRHRPRRRPKIDGQRRLLDGVHRRPHAGGIGARNKAPSSADRGRPIGIDACRAISAVHRAGLLHRDIKAKQRHARGQRSHRPPGLRREQGTSSSMR